MQSLPRISPLRAGIAVSGLDAFTRAACDIGLHSFMLVRHGAVAAEVFWEPFAPDYTHMLFSLSKSFTSTAIGFAVQEGLLSVQDRVVDFFPEYFRDAPAEGNLAKVTLQHLLTMSCGHDVEATVLDGVYHEDWVELFLRHPVPLEPGSTFMYNTTGTYMLSAVLSKVTGQCVRDYLEPRLFAPLGIENIYWESCPRGISAGGFGLNVRTEDIAKFGLFCLQKGQWQGRQLLNAAWFDEATAFHISNAGPGKTPDWSAGYGYQFWRCIPPTVYRGDGAFGQLCVVIPSHDAVFACTGNIRDFQELTDAIWNHLLPAMSDPRDVEEPLYRRTLQWQFDAPIHARRISDGRFATRFELQGAPYGLKKLALHLGEDQDSVTVTDERGTYSLALGRGKWLEGKTYVRSGPGSFDFVLEDAAAQGGWTDENTFRFSIQYTRSPMHDEWEVKLSRKGASVRYRKLGSFVGGEYAFVGVREA